MFLGMIFIPKNILFMAFAYHTLRKNQPNLNPNDKIDLALKFRLICQQCRQTEKMYAI